MSDGNGGFKEKKSSIQVGGMTCVSCAKTIENSLERLKGVNKATVNFAAEKVAVEHDPTKVNKEKIYQTIENSGYQPIKEKQGKKEEITLKISGMTCASCADNVEKALSELNGVYAANVNLATEKARVEYSPDLVTISTMRKAVDEAGYGVESEEKKEKELEEVEKAKNRTLIGQNGPKTGKHSHSSRCSQQDSLSGGGCGGR